MIPQSAITVGVRGKTPPLAKSGITVSWLAGDEIGYQYHYDDQGERNGASP